jgi:DNA-binding transcriptional ArsR family regulator
VHRHRLRRRDIVNLKVNGSTRLDRSFVALSHPVRRAIVERLADGPATVGEATRGVAISKPAVTKHLKVLEQAGVVRRAVEGRTHRLWLEPAPLDAAAEWLELHRSLWEAKFDAVESHLGEEDERRSDGRN